MANKYKKTNIFSMEKIASRVMKAAGSNTAILFAFGTIILWGILGPAFNYSPRWQLIINTGTNIFTFLMVFLIQKSQNKESLAVQLKLNELVAAHEFASNRLVDVENMTEAELQVIQKYYSKLKIDSIKEESLQHSHSMDEADKKEKLKKEREEQILAELKAAKAA